jgi:hypothetical protein
MISFNNGAPTRVKDGNRENMESLAIDGTQPSQGCVLRDCALYNPPHVTNVLLFLGNHGINHQGVDNRDIVVQDNTIAGMVRVNDWRRAIVTGNTFYLPDVPDWEWEFFLSLRAADATKVSGYTWDANTYYDQSSPQRGVRRPFLTHFRSPRNQIRYVTFDEWRGDSARDASSTYREGLPPNRVLVRPNEYEPGRAHIAVYNWERLPAVAVDLRGAGLSEGQAFEIRNCQNLFGAPVATGTYRAAAPTVSLPMSDPQVTAPIGFSAYPIPTTLPEFGAFIVLPLEPRP